MSDSVWAVQSCLKNMLSYLKTKIPALTVYSEWPNENDKLIFPAVTLLSGKIGFMNLMIEQDSVSDPDVDGRVTAVEVIGEYDFKMQLDLWCTSKFQRDVLMGQIIDALNPISASPQGDQNTSGVALQLTDYFNSWANFSTENSQYIDDEAGAQRQERRAKIDILVNCRAIRARTYYAIGEIQTFIGTPDQAAEMEDNTDDTDQSTV